MSGGPFFPFSMIPVTSQYSFPNIHVGAGSGVKNIEGAGFDASLGADAEWDLAFSMPPALPTGDPYTRLGVLVNASTGIAIVSIEWASVDVLGTITSVRTASYQWTASGSGTNEYYLEASGGGDPSVNQPNAILIGDAPADMPGLKGTLGALAAGEWGWGDNDTLGFSTVYVRLSDGADPDSKSTDHIKIVEAGEDPSSVTLNSEGNLTIEATTGDADNWITVDIPMNADTVVADEDVVMKLKGESTGWTLAQVSTWVPRIVFK